MSKRTEELARQARERSSAETQHHQGVDLRQIERKLEKIMANTQELVQTLRNVADQQRKTIQEIGTLQNTTDELNARVKDLEDVIAKGEVSQELSDAVQAVKELAQQVDEQIPDVTPVPTP